MTTLLPLEDHVIIEAIKEETTTASWIVLPDTTKEKPSKWIVIAVGAGKILDNGQRWPVDIKAGDVVYFTKYAPDEIEVKEWGTTKAYLVVKQSSLLAKQV